MNRGSYGGHKRSLPDDRLAVRRTLNLVRDIPQTLPLLDLTARVDEPAVVGVWSLAVYRPDERKIAERVALYRPPNTRRMYGFEHDGVVLACMGCAAGPLAIMNECSAM